jgi:hypothetical protein
VNYAEIPNAELDDMMATRVMGWAPHGGDWRHPDGIVYTSGDYWQPSTMYEPMVDVLFKALEDGYAVENISKGKEGYGVEFGRFESDGYYYQHVAHAPTLPRALCEAIAAAYEERK